MSYELERDESKDLSDIEIFSQKVRNRILRDFLAQYKKPKLTLWNKVSISLMPFTTVIGWAMIYWVFNSNLHLTPNKGMLFFIIALLMACSPFLLLTNLGNTRNLMEGQNPYKTKTTIGNYIRGFMDYPKESRRYFGTLASDIPQIKNNDDLEQYLIDKCDQFFTNGHIYLQNIKSYLNLTPEEIQCLLNSNINSFQKQFFINKGGYINLSDLDQAKYFNSAKHILLDPLKAEKKYFI